MISNKKLLAVWVSFLLTLLFTQGTFADTSYQVKPSDNLNEIADKHYQGSGLTRSQILVGIYASNPKSFRNGDINKLRRGQKLVLPDADKIDKISPHEAELVLSAKTQKTGKKKKIRKKSLKKRRIKKRSKTKRKKKKSYRKSAIALQKKSREKLNKLEKESELLKKRLDALLAEKSASDNKLKELEKSLQLALKEKAARSKAVATASVVTNNKTTTNETTTNESTTKTTSIEEAEKIKKEPVSAISESERVTQKANEKLRETNALLEKNLQESKKEIASRTRNDLAKEQAIKTAQITAGSSESIPFDTSNKYIQWALLSLLLFPLVWFAKRLLGGKKEEEQPAWVAETDGQSTLLATESTHIDTGYQEAPVESSIKLDVASAYLESGDTAEAVEILNEILSEGNAEQKAQAQELLDQYT